MLSLLLKPLSLMSLPAIHRLGALLGRLMFLFMPQSKQLIVENLRQSHLFKDELSLKQAVKSNIEESGKSILETFAIWQKSEQELVGLIKQTQGWNDVEAAVQAGKGVIFLTPHLGCFEIASIYYGSQYPVTVLFRAPKMKWILPLIEKGRTRTDVTLAEANTSGVRKLMQALKKGEAVGILPDQIPSAGEGEWAPFFGKPAYTMTLASKLANKTGAAVIAVFGERLPKGEGFIVHCKRLEDGAIATPALLNKAIEKQIEQQPTQYLWNYPRYKLRRHALNNDTAGQESNSPDISNHDYK
ncbi:MAG: lysophospholipid acyltransferase family protein [Methylotenera sp.]|uniref:lysophospholipid acyltransferase family protein n=1 Tax=Methylotenera sp. TaxID=2051956 RepID=UPI002489B486|nr:lysophospholipid acyltransferase family protein [Methylotenera sp.]MDI1308263.1 lysophospholipid acyltransferase family protein [Methylotenera sp.]